MRRKTSCNSKYVFYVAYCVRCGKQGVGSTVSWKPRLANYKSHIKKRVASCKIVRHFIEDCVDQENPSSLIRFIIVDIVNNNENLNSSTMEELLLNKEKFWIGTLVTQHQGLNGTHDWNRKRRNDKEK